MDVTPSNVIWLVADPLNIPLEPDTTLYQGPKQPPLLVEFPAKPFVTLSSVRCTVPLFAAEPDVNYRFKEPGFNPCLILALSMLIT